MSPIGNVYIADHYNHRIHKVTLSTGIISTIAGTGTSSFSGDGGPATAAELSSPGAVALDASGIFLPLFFLFPNPTSLLRQRVYQ
jgi:hypothetical protein